MGGEAPYKHAQIIKSNKLLDFHRNRKEIQLENLFN